MNNLEDIPFSLIAEVNPRTSTKHLTNDMSVSFIPMSDVTETGQWIHHQERKLEDLLGHGYTPFQEGDILFAKITPCMENGKGAHAIGLVNGIGLGTTEFHVLRAKVSGNDRFIYHCLQSNLLRLKAERLMIGSAGQRRVAPNFFHVYYIPYFSPFEQYNIANILDTIEGQIQHTEQLITKLKLQRIGLLHKLLTCGINDHGQLRAISTSLTKGSQKIELKSFPKEWEIYQLGKIAQVGAGLTLGKKFSGPDTMKLPYLRVANVQDGYLDLNDIKTVSIPKENVAKYILQSGDVLMTEGGDFDKLGRGAIWKDQISPCLHQNHIFRIRPNKHFLLPEFLTIISSSSYGKWFFMLSSKQSTNLASINSTQLKSFPIPCPSIAEQEQIISIISEYDKNVGVEEAHLNKLKLYKNGLMHDLLTGKVRVVEKQETADS